MMKKQIKKLEKLDPCHEAIEWLKEQTNRQQAWDDCKHGDWMLWLLGKLSGPPKGEKRKPLVLACCECARLSLKYVEKGEKRPRIAIETAEKWARGVATIEDVSASYAYYAYYASASSSAASSASSAYSSASSAYASSAASYASALKECANIVRKHYPQAPKL